MPATLPLEAVLTLWSGATSVATPGRPGAVARGLPPRPPPPPPPSWKFWLANCDAGAGGFWAAEVM